MLLYEVLLFGLGKTRAVKVTRTELLWFVDVLHA
jgi:hypothetical protein